MVETSFTAHGAWVFQALGSEIPGEARSKDIGYDLRRLPVSRSGISHSLSILSSVQRHDSIQVYQGYVNRKFPAVQLPISKTRGRSIYPMMRPVVLQTDIDRTIVT